MREESEERGAAVSDHARDVNKAGPLKRRGRATDETRRSHMLNARVDAAWPSSLPFDSLHCTARTVGTCE